MVGDKGDSYYGILTCLKVCFSFLTHWYFSAGQYEAHALGSTVCVTPSYPLWASESEKPRLVK